MSMSTVLVDSSWICVQVKTSQEMDVASQIIGMIQESEYSDRYVNLAIPRTYNPRKFNKYDIAYPSYVFMQVLLSDDNQDLFDFIRKVPGVLKVLGFEESISIKEKPIIRVSKLKDSHILILKKTGDLFYYPDTKVNPVKLNQIVSTKSGFKGKVTSIIDSKTVEVSSFNGNTKITAPIYKLNYKDVSKRKTTTSFGSINRNT